MNHEVAVIDQDPFGGVVAFDAVGELARLLKLFLDFVRDGVGLAGIGNRADDEVVGERSDVAEIQDGQVRSFFRLGRARGSEPTGQFLDGGGG